MGGGHHRVMNCTGKHHFRNTKNGNPRQDTLLGIAVFSRKTNYFRAIRLKPVNFADRKNFQVAPTCRWSGQAAKPTPASAGWPVAAHHAVERPHFFNDLPLAQARPLDGGIFRQPRGIVSQYLVKNIQQLGTGHHFFCPATCFSNSFLWRVWQF